MFMTHTFKCICNEILFRIYNYSYDIVIRPIVSQCTIVYTKLKRVNKMAGVFLYNKSIHNARWRLLVLILRDQIRLPIDCL